MSPSTPAENPLRPRSGDAIGYHRAIYFGLEDLTRLSTASMLNDVCMNDCASLLQRLFNSPQSNQCAVLSTFAVTDHRAAMDDSRIWRVTQSSRFWAKTKWIIPIHRPGHWVLCVADISSQHIDFFDSLAGERDWLVDIKVRYPIFIYTLSHVFC